MQAFLSRLKLLAASLAIVVPSASAALADQVKVAVAANFTEAAKAIAAAFKADTGHEAALSFGSTGQLYAQITQGAPFEVFLAADAARPEKAVEEGFGVQGSAFTYAIGKIVLWSTDPNLVTGAQTLQAGRFDKIAIANPGTAPYGTAAIEAMSALNVYDSLQPKIVQGANIAQAYQFVKTGNAELGFVALSQIADNTDGSRWVVSDDLYDPIRQDAVLLKTGQGNPAAEAFLSFLKGAAAVALIEKFGYGVDIAE
ncbi:molybdate ABC transporter substrate-binding protein [Hoeflea sp. WL0058]|uniref:Molybdate ABC transporter substrate-binding protein n=1 Tax=Flavimaribacter sediminis TaxID=2865987 RepID=A0AAE3D4D0_9HYPH|nr:molybdate ABC transporter substrate-binding protein [Flavimaribacter sediminis]MBW8640718.1 molybdate ABC transporter substrate-binding protein [Flavimaribacter sediminis]